MRITMEHSIWVYYTQKKMKKQPRLWNNGQVMRQAGVENNSLYSHFTKQKKAKLFIVITRTDFTSHGLSVLCTSKASWVE